MVVGVIVVVVVVVVVVALAVVVPGVVTAGHAGAALLDGGQGRPVLLWG